jgi:hypothetical protein
LLRASRPLSVRRLLDTKVDNRSTSRSGQKDEALTKLTHPRMQRYNDTSGKGRACDSNSYQRSCLSASLVESVLWLTNREITASGVARWRTQEDQPLESSSPSSSDSPAILQHSHFWYTSAERENCTGRHTGSDIKVQSTRHVAMGVTETYKYPSLMNPLTTPSLPCRTAPGFQQRYHEYRDTAALTNQG